MNFFTFDGINSSDYGVYISGSGTFDAPERDVDKVSVPGRSGDLLIDNGRFKNVPISYPAFIVRDFTENFETFKDFMCSVTSYKRLEDTYHPEYYRMGCFKGPIKPKTKTLNRSGEFDIEFDCKPQRWLKEGEQVIGLQNSGKIINPTNFPAKPLIRVYGTGSLYIGEYGIQIISAEEYTDIDCETQDAYKGTVNCNGNIRRLTKKFPVIKSGETEIVMEGITLVEIIPRWWTI